MKTFAMETDPAAGVRALAETVMERAARVTRLVVAEVRRHQAGGLAYSQARALGALRASPDISLGELADRLGVGAPTASKVVEELVHAGLAEREVDGSDRRRVTLRATGAGAAALEAALEPARSRTAELLGQLPAEERAVVERAMEILEPLFAPVGRESR